VADPNTCSGSLLDHADESERQILILKVRLEVGHGGLLVARGWLDGIDKW
jgi:hypothetical protein